uniref:Uncharacterized protein n=1 Tax=Megaselia scalaris TaxID=36166 RepID=T1GMG9_MEGSC
MVIYRLILVNILLINYGLAQVDISKLNSIESYQEVARGNLDFFVGAYSAFKFRRILRLASQTKVFC